MVGKPIQHYLNKPITPPFRGLLILCWVYFILCFFLHPESALLVGRFIDPDDSMYLVHTLDWVNGQGWFDRVEHRMNPPEGVFIHFSRLMEIPYAFTIVLLKPFVGSLKAALATAAIWPLLFLLSLMIIYKRLMGEFIDKRWAGLVSFVVILSTNTTFAFMPGQIDHHGFVALLLLLSMTVFVVSIRASDKVLLPLIVGFILSLALVISLEILPFLLLFAFFVVVVDCAEGGIHKIKPIHMGLSLSTTGTFLLFLQRPFGSWLEMDLANYSAAYVLILYGISALFFALKPIARLRNNTFRFLSVVILALVLAAIYLNYFPQMESGPYGAVDPSLTNFLLPNITEAVPLIDRLDFQSLIFVVMPSLMIALSYAFFRIIRPISHLRLPWMLVFLMLFSSALLAIFYQSRYLLYASIFSTVPLTAFLYDRLNERTRIQENSRIAHLYKRAQKIGWVLIYPFLLVAVPAIFYQSSWNDTLFFPMLDKNPACDLRETALLLSRPPYFEGVPKLIMNTLDEGPELLLRTPHQVIAAPFHNNLTGNIDATTFFRSKDAALSEEIARRRGINFVISCRDIEGGYLINENEKINFKDPALRVSNPPPLVYKITTMDIPIWLKPLSSIGSDGTLAFQVVLSKNTKP